MRTQALTRNSGLRRNYGENPCPYHLALPAAVTYGHDILSQKVCDGNALPIWS